MIIAIDGNEANVKNRVGVNQFAFELLWGIYRQKGRGEFIVFLAEKPLFDLPPEKRGWSYEVLPSRFFWTWTALPKRLFFGRPRPDLVFSLSHYGPGFSPFPSVVSVMDLGFLRFPGQFTKKDFFQLKYLTGWSVKRAKKIIAISQFTKDDLIKSYHINPEKIVVAYPGFKKTRLRQKSPSLNSLRKKYGIEGEYILSLSTLKPSKNIEGLIEGFGQARKEWGKKMSLVITGKKGWLFETIFQKAKDLGLEKEVIFTDFIPDDEVGPLLSGASLFAMPSFWEGFGIPVLEAMAAGIPVVCGNAGSLPEIAGRAAILVDPKDTGAIGKSLVKGVNDQKLREKLIKAGKKRASEFSWEKCSSIILKLLLEIVKKEKEKK